MIHAHCPKRTESRPPRFGEPMRFEFKPDPMEEKLDQIIHLLQDILYELGTLTPNR